MTGPTTRRRIFVTCAACSLTAALFFLCYFLCPAATHSAGIANPTPILRSVHSSLGLVVALGALVILVSNVLDIHALHGSHNMWLDVGVHTLQFALYSMLIVVTGGAVAGAWLSGHAVVSIMGYSIAPGIASSDGLGHMLNAAHIAASKVLLWVVCGQLLVVALLHLRKRAKRAKRG